MRVFHLALSAVYDPAAQGEIRTIDFSEDCRAVLNGYVPYTVPMLEQGGRRYVANSTSRRSCASSDWTAVFLRASLVPTDFVLADGPACGVGESCPDFSAAGAPITLGLASGASLTSGLPPGTVSALRARFRQLASDRLAKVGGHRLPATRLPRPRHAVPNDAPCGVGRRA